MLACSIFRDSKRISDLNKSHFLFPKFIYFLLSICKKDVYKRQVMTNHADNFSLRGGEGDMM